MYEPMKKDPELFASSPSRILHWHPLLHRLFYTGSSTLAGVEEGAGVEEAAGVEEGAGVDEVTG